MNARLRGLIEWIVPERTLSALKLRRESSRDRALYAEYAGPDDRKVSSSIADHNVEMQLTKDYHRIEKGLSLAEPKRPFGSEVARRIDLLLQLARERGLQGHYLENARTARTALEMWNDTAERDDDIAPASSAPYVFAAPGEVAEFFQSRHSVRSFSRRPVANESLDAAVALALATPSVCNRQAWKVHAFRGTDATHALRHQNGSAAFAASVPLALLITVDMTMFAGANERNQVFIEGGLFAMTLTWALHGMGLNSCMLNMSRSTSDLATARAELGIPRNEKIIMFMAVGYAERGARRARSPRRELTEVLIRHRSEGHEA